MKQRTLRLALVSTALLAVAGGIAYATIPSSSGVISGCFEKRTGILRVIDTSAGQSCTRFETPISWNQAGPKGDQGLQGARGAIGPTGAQGVAGASGEDGMPGRDGADGAAGARGATGPTGETGAKGGRGPTGPQGTAGVAGVAGARGATGPQGLQGLRGPTGPAGTAAFTGQAVAISTTPRELLDQPGLGALRAYCHPDRSVHFDWMNLTSQQRPERQYVSWAEGDIDSASVLDGPFTTTGSPTLNRGSMHLQVFMPDRVGQASFLRADLAAVAETSSNACRVWFRLEGPAAP